MTVSGSCVLNTDLRPRGDSSTDSWAAGLQSYSKGYTLPVSFPIACSNALPPGKMGEASSGDLRTMVIDPVGHVNAQRPQPMHLSSSMTVWSFSVRMALTWHRSTQVPQSVQVSSSLVA